MAERFFLCNGGLSALWETLVSLAQGVLVQRCGDDRGGLAAMLQAQRLDGVRRRQIGSGGRKEILSWGNIFMLFSYYSLSSSWLV